MKFGLSIIFVMILLVSGLFLLSYHQQNGIIVSPLAKKGFAFPTPTPQPTSTPTPTPSPSTTPTPTPTPSPIPLSSAELDELFTKYANLYSVDRNLLVKIAGCESGFNPNAVNGDYVGLFQFSSSAWINSRALMGQDTSLTLRNDPEESIKTAAFKISRGEQSAWPYCSR